MKLTGWYQSSQKPVRKGVYQRDASVVGWSAHVPTFSYWDGERWGISDKSVGGADIWGTAKSQYQNLPWRGLAKKPRTRK